MCCASDSFLPESLRIADMPRREASAFGEEHLHTEQNNSNSQKEERQQQYFHKLFGKINCQKSLLQCKYMKGIINFALNSNLFCNLWCS